MCTHKTGSRVGTAKPGRGGIKKDLGKEPAAKGNLSTVLLEYDCVR